MKRSFNALIGIVYCLITGALALGFLALIGEGVGDAIKGWVDDMSFWYPIFSFLVGYGFLYIGYWFNRNYEERKTQLEEKGLVKILMDKFDF